MKKKIEEVLQNNLNFILNMSSNEDVYAELGLNYGLYEIRKMEDSLNLTFLNANKFSKTELIGVLKHKFLINFGEIVESKICEKIVDEILN